MSHVIRKPVSRVSDQFRHKLGCTAIEDVQWLEISDLERGDYTICNDNKSVDQLGDYHAADLRLYFSICKKQVFSRCSPHVVFQHYIHGSSQGQFVAETYMVMLLSILSEKAKH